MNKLRGAIEKRRFTARARINIKTEVEAGRYSNVAFSEYFLRCCVDNAILMHYRHHTNPVGTEWRWQMDDPDLIVDGAMQNHYNMIKQFRGIFSRISLIMLSGA